MFKLCVVCLTAAGDDPVHLPVQEHSHGGLHQSTEVLKLPGGSYTIELQIHRNKRAGKSQIMRFSPPPPGIW